MVEIIVKAPRRKNRAYVFADDRDAERFIEQLDKKATRVKIDPISIAELEDLSDIVASDKAIRELARGGRMYSWEEVKSELGL